MKTQNDTIQSVCEEVLRGMHSNLSHLLPVIEDFRKPIFTFKEIHEFIDEITYKKLNDWDNKGLISGTREKEESGWRKFSAADVIKFLIIADLRKIGLAIEEIVSILKKLAPYPLKIKEDVISIPQIEYSIVAALSNAAFVILIDDQKTPYFLTEDIALKLHFLEKPSSPIIILPFGFYVSRLVGKPLLFKNETSVWRLLTSGISHKEIDIINIIRNHEYKEVIIKQKDGTELHQVKAKVTRRGDFTDEEIIKGMSERAFQKVTVVVRNGKKEAVEYEQSIQI